MCQTLRNSDLFWMQRALSLAEGVCGHVWPNPAVGCVLVKGDTVVAEAATHPGGRPHAERKALDQAGSAAKGTTLYVTLEPCCHWGKTPPCADAIIKAGVSRVVCAIQDPDPRVNGGGFEKLKGAGLDVEVGLCSDEAESLMSGFFRRIKTGVPELIACDPLSNEIPDRLDALLVLSGRGRELITRSNKVEYLPQTTSELLKWMGDLGLTSVGIPTNDPLWHDLSAAQTTVIPQRSGIIYSPIVIER